MMDKSRARGHLLACISVLFWSTTFVSTKILQDDFSSLEILLIRFVIGFVALFLMHPRPIKWEGWGKEVQVIAAGFFGIFLYYLMENIALEYSSASMVSLVVSTAPFFIAIVFKFLDWRGTRLRAHFFLGFLVTFAGLVLSVMEAGEAIRLDLGVLIALAASIAWGFYSWFLDRLGRWGDDSIALTRRSFLYGILFMIPLAMLDGFNVGRELLEPVNIANLLFLGLGASAFCFAAWAGAVKRLGPLLSGSYIYIIPAVTMVFSAIVLGESISMRFIVGTALVITGLFISNSKDHKDLTKAFS